MVKIPISVWAEIQIRIGLWIIPGFFTFGQLLNTSSGFRSPTLAELEIFLILINLLIINMIIIDQNNYLNS